MSAADLWGLFNHFLLLSLLAVGGAITTAPDMHRYLVTEHQWLTDAQFNASIAIAQAAPGPNVLFVAVLGWNTAGAWGAFAAMTGILLPSTVVSLWATRWAAQRKQSRGVRALKATRSCQQRIFWRMPTQIFCRWTASRTAACFQVVTATVHIRQ